MTGNGRVDMIGILGRTSTNELKYVLSASFPMAPLLSPLPSSTIFAVAVAVLDDELVFQTHSPPPIKTQHIDR